MSHSVYITGTDTGVGKTYVTVRLIRGLRARGVDAVGFKPICCGGREDAEAIEEAADGAVTLNEVNPVWLRTPAAPLAAALVENRMIDLALIRETYAALRARHAAVLVEGIGGWLVPIRADLTVADLAAEWQLPVVVVVANRLGALNHAALTLRAIEAGGLVCAGIILNQSAGSVGPDDPPESIARATNREVLEHWLGVRILAEVGTDADVMPISV